MLIQIAAAEVSSAYVMSGQKMSGISKFLVKTSNRPGHDFRPDRDRDRDRKLQLTGTKNPELTGTGTGIMNQHLTGTGTGTGMKNVT